MHESLPCRNGNVGRKCFGVLFFLASLLVGNYGYSQVGTTCENPIVISALPYTTSDDTANYADNYDPSEDNDPECETTTSGNSYHKGNDVIYSYTPATDTSIDIEMPDGVAWSGMFVYADCADIGLVYAACATSTSSGDRIINDFPVVGGQTYYILLSIWATPQTYAYTLNVTENTCTEHSVVFDVVADCDNGEQFMVTADVTNMGSATSITVTDNQGNAPQELTAAGTLTFGPYDNLTEVVLTAANTSDGNCVVVSDELTQAACPPANDECAGAIALTVNPDLSCAAVTSATTLGATESMEAECSGNPDDDVWFTFEAEAEMHVIALSNIDAVAGTSEDMYYEVMSGTCGILESVFCTDYDTDTVEGLTIGETYYVRVYSYYASSRQTFDICVGTLPPPPANDVCANAVALTVGDDFESAAIVADNTTATNNAADPLPSCDAYNFATNGKDVWFTVVVPASGSVILETGSNDDDNIEDTGLAAYSGTCGDITALDCNSDDGEGNFSLLELSGLTPGETLLVRAWGYNTDAGSFKIAAYDTCNAQAPEGDEEQTLAPGNTIADLDVEGDELTWYSDEALTTEIPATTVAVDGATYYVTQVEDECISPALAITVTLVDPCAGTLAPEADAEQTLNIGQTLADLEVEGEELTWYSDEALTTEVPATTVAVDGTTYYVTQTVGECTSAATAITVTVVDPCAGVLAPEAAAAQTLDLGQTLADLEVEGENLTWYADAELTNEIPDTTVAVNGTVYYVTQTVGECTSAAAEINVTVVDPCEGTLAPAGDEEQEFSTGETLADLDVTGENLTWYADAELTTEIPATTALVDGTTYYVTQTVGECVSAALAVTVNEILGTGGLDKASFRYYPNPVANVLTLSYAEAITNVTVYNMLGQPVITATLNATEGTVDVSRLAGGNYLVKVQAGDAATTIKIVKN